MKKIFGVALIGLMAMGCSGSPEGEGEKTGEAEGASMTGCNGAVCIHIQGTGTYVQYITVTVKQTGNVLPPYVVNPEAYLEWYEAGVPPQWSGWKTAGNIYYQSYTFQWNFYRYFPNNTKMCAHGFEDTSDNAEGAVGVPCGYIHS
jgi:hypothetical protein